MKEPRSWSRRGFHLQFPLRQTLTLVGTEAGPLEAAGKDVSAVVKSVDGKLAAVGIMLEKVKSHCKGCPSVSTRSKLHIGARQLNPSLKSNANVYAGTVPSCDLGSQDGKIIATYFC